MKRYIIAVAVVVISAGMAAANITNEDLDKENVESALSVFGIPGFDGAGMRMYFEGNPATYPWTFDENDNSYRYGWPIPKNFLTTSGVEEISGSAGQSIKLYPIPATTTVTVSGAGEGTEISVYTIGGIKVKSVPSGGTGTIIDISSLPSGIYIVTVGTERLRMIKR